MLNEELGGGGISHTSFRLGEYPIRFLYSIILLSRRKRMQLYFKGDFAISSLQGPCSDLTMRITRPREHLLLSMAWLSESAWGGVCRRLKTLGTSTTIWTPWS